MSLTDVCTDVCEHIVEFIEIQEYMALLKISKKMHRNVSHMIDDKKPHIFAYNDCYGGYTLSQECKLLLRELRIGVKKSNEYMRHACAVPRAVLKLGSIKSSGKYAHINLMAVPWKFRKCINFCEYDGKETPTVDTNKYLRDYIRDKGEFAKEKKDWINEDEKNIFYIQFAKKIITVEKEMQKYNSHGSPHMDKYTERLERLVNDDE